jgi:hypothetical protein
MNLNLSADSYVGLQWDSDAQETNVLFANFSRIAPSNVIDHIRGLNC